MKFNRAVLVSLARARKTAFSEVKHRVGASVAAVRRAGGMTAVDTMNHFMLNKEMIVIGSTYWNMVYGKNIGDVLADGEGISNMRNLGQNMAWLLNRLQLNR